ncbi:ribonuclease VapC [Alphaproteobacteria bacterium]|nr:ribonuclease VapC [Alphaproteobacteria bacterium]
MILCDTNILIELYRNNPDIVDSVEFMKQENIAISDVTRAELFVGALNKRELQVLYNDVSQLTVMPILPDISTMSIELLLKYCLSHNLDFHDSLIAATAICHNIELYTLNIRDFIFIPGLKLYRPLFIN